MSILENPKEDGNIAVSYKSNAVTIRTKQYRSTQHNKGAVELYDLFEKNNIGVRSKEVVTNLTLLLQEKVENKKNYESLFDVILMNRTFCKF